MNKTKKIIGVSLFANVGIAETFFADIDIEIKVANEIDEKRAKLYREIYPETNMISGDITDAKVFKEIVDESRKKR